MQWFIKQSSPHYSTSTCDIVSEIERIIYSAQATMKLSVIITLALVAAVVGSEGDDMMKLIKTCKDTVGASDEDLSKFLSHTPADSKAQKCMFSCIMDAMDIVSETSITS